MEKLSMGEYGPVVWGAYAVAFVVLACVSWISIRELKKARNSLRALEAKKDETPQQVRGL